MKLVDYSDSETDSSSEEPPHSPPPAPKPHHASLPPKPAKKQIIIDLPKPIKDDEPIPRKRSRPENAGGGGLFAVLPPPKRTKPSGASGANGGGNTLNGGNGNDTVDGKDIGNADGFMGEETILESESAGPATAGSASTGFVPRSTMAKKGKGSTKSIPSTKPPAAIDLFSLAAEPPSSKSPVPITNPSTYQPLITQSLPTDPLPYQTPQDPEDPTESFIPDTASAATSGISSIETSSLSSFAAHILEGRHRKNRTIQVTDYNAGEVYAQNAMDKLTGALQEQVAPVRAIGSGRHQLSQLLNNVQDQRESLEEAFAKGRRVKKESGAKYGW